MCNAHFSPTAGIALDRAIVIAKSLSSRPDIELCQSVVDQHLQPRWVDHIDQDCEPIAIMEIMDLQGNHVPAATMVLRGRPFFADDALTFRAEYTARLNQQPTLLSNLFGTRPGRRPAHHCAGIEADTVANMMVRSLAVLIHHEANRQYYSDLAKGRILPDGR